MNLKVLTQEFASSDFDGQVERTALLALWCRARDCISGSSILKDHTAVRTLSALNCDVTEFEAHCESAVTTVCLRSLVLDDRVRSFLRTVPESPSVPAIVELGCGLNSRLERLADTRPYSSIEVDLPSMAALRRKVMPSSVHRQVIAGSVLNDAWAALTAQRFGNEPKLFVMEGVSFYLNEIDMRRLLKMIATHFPGSWLIFDSVSSFWREHSRFEPVQSQLGVQFKFFLDEPSHLESWQSDIDVLDSSTWRDMPDSVRMHIEYAYPNMLGYDDVASSFRVNVLRVGNPPVAI